MKRAWIVIIVVTVVLVSAFSAVVIYSESRTPFGNIWEKPINGYLYSVVTNTNSVFVLSYSANYSLPVTLYYTITKYNLSTGEKKWVSPTIVVSGLDQCNRWLDKGLNLHYYGNNIYFSTINGSRINNFVVYGINASTGQIFMDQKISPQGIIYATMLSFSEVFLRNTLNLAFTEVYYNPRGNGNTSQYFISNEYTLAGSEAVLRSSSNITIDAPYIGSSTSSESILISGNNVIYHLNQLNTTFIQNTSSGRICTLNFTGNPLCISGESLIYSLQNQTNISFFRYDIKNDSVFKILTLKNIISDPRRYEAIVRTLPNHVFGITVTYSEIGPSNLAGAPQNQKNIIFMGINMKGKVIWNVSLAPDSYGTSTRTLGSGNGEVLFYTLPAAYASNSFTSAVTYHTNIMVINTTSGKTVVDTLYKYSVDYPSGKQAFLSPPPFLGVVTFSNNYLIYIIGNNLACTKIGN